MSEMPTSKQGACPKCPTEDQPLYFEHDCPAERERRAAEARSSKKMLDFEQRRRAVELEETIDGDGAYDVAAEVIWSRDEITRLQQKLLAAEQLAVRQGNEIRKLRAGERA